MKKDLLYTVIITNYNNTKYLRNALLSVFKQNYNNIQLIITDDCSKDFNLFNTKSLINQEKSSNIKKIDFIINKENIGTVKTLNRALSIAEGDYILFFASDDELYDENVLKNYVYYFDTKKVNIITSKWRQCDNNMQFLSDNIKSFKGKKLNLSIKKMYYEMCKSNLYGSGSTSYRKIVFDKYGLFDIKYTLLEDWPYWLKLLNENEKIYFANFNGLNHRDGGISKSLRITKSVIIFRKEILKTFTDEIIPNINVFTSYKQFRILKSFEYHIFQYNMIDNKEYYSILKEQINKNIKIKILWIMNNYFPNIIEKIIILFKYNIIVPLSAIMTFFVNILFVNRLSLSKNILFILYILVYLIVYIINNVILNIIHIKKG